MAGIAGVVVSPEYRGHGVGTGLMTCDGRRGRELGYPVSVLYPATVLGLPPNRVGGRRCQAADHDHDAAAARPPRRRRRRGARSRTEGCRGACSRSCASGTPPTAPTDRATPRSRSSPRSSVTPMSSRMRPTTGSSLYGWEDKDIVVYQLVAGVCSDGPRVVVGRGLELVHRRADARLRRLRTTRSTSCSARWSDRPPSRPVDAAAARRRGGATAVAATRSGCTSRCRWCSRTPLLPGNAVAGRLQVDDGSRSASSSMPASSTTPDDASGSEQTASLRCTPGRRRPACGSGLILGGDAEQLALAWTRLRRLVRRTCSTTSEPRDATIGSARVGARRRPARDDAARGRAPRRC